MTGKTNRLELYIGILLTVSLAAVVLRTIALFLDFDVGTHYFNSKILINSASIVLAIGVLFLFTYAFSSEAKKPLIANFTSPATFVPTTIVVVALVYFSIGALTKVDSLGITLSQAISESNTTYFIWEGLFLLSLLAVVYFILNALVEKRASTARASFGILTVLFFALYSAHFFFSTELQLNAPNKVVDQLAYLFAALFFLYEIRISLGRECWNLYIAFGFVAAPMLAYSAFPTLIYYIFTGICVSASIFEVALTLSLFLFVTSRLILTESLVEEKVDDTVLLIKEAFEKKSAYLAEKEGLGDSIDEPEKIAAGDDLEEPDYDLGGENDEPSDSDPADSVTPHYDPDVIIHDDTQAVEPDTNSSDTQ